jgi:hypothetical protein
MSDPGSHRLASRGGVLETDCASSSGLPPMGFGTGAWMGVSADDAGSLKRNSWDESRLDHYQEE